MNQNNNLNSFREFILETLKKRFKKTIEYREKLQTVSTLLSDSSPKLDGRVFYNVLKLLNEDIDKVCKTFYSQHSAHILDSLKKTENRFANLISPYLNSQNQISESSQISSKRFNRLFAGELKELYADEVYGLAKAFDLKPSQLFEYFYGDGERPVVRA
ncbi:helix-turn-helix domain-containing protein [Sphingobacterium haloxyli]|uniref:HTH cro/C1-type domain-containing protein n=1 Tax=Sphingobacterium haloxyli TaxID=2100533 RepID=A0A2S9J2A3_9SPHI|nr:helix-turn-helix domain-containing protein [Sphingobacterium haloxyli]PRD46913.1 hypothetical protein C5745_12500 [Sphingobacterium haloxyli]